MLESMHFRAASVYYLDLSSCAEQGALHHKCGSQTQGMTC